MLAYRIGVCSWSLKPTSPSDLVEKIKALGPSKRERWSVQLALDPLRTGAWSTDETLRALHEGGIEIRSGMMAMRGEDYTTLTSIQRTGGVRADEHWEANLTAATQNAELARTLGIKLVTFHAGFIPHERDDPVRAMMMDRLRGVIDIFAAAGVRVALETGQETAATLLDALDQLDRPDVGINFDPANMILYGMGEPVAALRELASTSGGRQRVAQMHIKDAVAAEEPGAWGREVPVGTGQVDWRAFFQTARNADLSCDLMIEREAGDDRTGDIRQAREVVDSNLQSSEARSS